MTGCTLLVDPASSAFLGTIALVTSAGGTDIPLPLPDRPLFHQNLYAQAFWIAPNYNPAGIAATRGLRMQVR